MNLKIFFSYFLGTVIALLLVSLIVALLTRILLTGPRHTKHAFDLEGEVYAATYGGTVSGDAVKALISQKPEKVRVSVTNLAGKIYYYFLGPDFTEEGDNLYLSGSLPNKGEPGYVNPGASYDGSVCMTADGIYDISFIQTK